MKLISKFQLGKNIEVPDLVTLVAIRLLNPTSPLYKYLLQSLANDIREREGEKLHYINKESPLYFNYNGTLYVLGSELLKLPLIFTHMGWINPKDANIDSDKYYTYNNGLFDHTHHVDFLDSDTYSPMEDSMQNLIINTIYSRNKQTGVLHDRKNQGNITSLRGNKDNVIPVLTGFSPGLDATYDYDKDAYLLGWKGLTSVLDLALGLTGPGAAIYSPYIINSGYERVKNAEHWWDYPLGVGEATLGVLPFVRPIRQGYRAIRGSFDPTYRLSKTMDSALEYPDFDFYNEPYAIDDYLGHIPKIGSTLDLHATYGTKYDWDVRHFRPHFVEEPDIQDLTQALESGFYFGKPLEALLPGQTTSIIGTTAKLYPKGLISTLSRFPHINFSRSAEKPAVEGSLGFRSDAPIRFKTIDEEGNRIEVPGTPEYIGDLSKVDETTNLVRFNVVNENGQLKVKTVYPDDESLSYDPGKKSPGRIALFHAKNGTRGENADYTAAQKYYDSHLINLSEFNSTTPELLLKRFPEYLFDPSKVPTPSVTSAEGTWLLAKDKILADIESAAYREHLRRELGSYSPYREIPDIIRRRFNNTEIFGIDPRANDYPAGSTGYALYENEGGFGLYNNLQSSGKAPKTITENQYLSLLTPEELAAYNRAKYRTPVVEIEEGDAAARYNVALEEGLHLLDLNDHLSIADAPVMKLFDAHNKPLIDAIISNRPLFGGKEFLPRAREAQRAYRKVKDKLPKYYAGKTSMSPERLFYLQLLQGSDLLFKAFPELEEFNPTTNRLIWELGHEYRKTPALWEGILHIVQNNATPQENNYTIT